MSYSRIEYSVTDTYFDYLKPPLSKMITVSKDMCFDFIVIGATARDFLIRYVFHADMTDLRATKDIDFAMLINDWGRYEEITQKMTADYGFVGTRYKQKFKHESIDIDIIPFGGISEKGYIFWPPDGSTRMSVKGFKEVYNSGIIINYDTIKFKILSLFGIFITKLIAWNDRKVTKKTDAEDIGTLLYHYNEFYPNDLFDYYPHLVNTPNYDYRLAGVKVLGKRLKLFLKKHSELHSEILTILHEETKDEDNSQLAHFLNNMETYETNLEALKNLLQELS